jgi:twitching motility two-component system response regulator PilG
MSEVLTSTNEILNEAVAAIKEGDRPKGRQLLKTCIERGQDELAAWHWLSSIADDPLESIKCLRNMLSIDPDHKVALKSIAWLLLRAGIQAGRQNDRRTALKHFDELLQLDPSHEIALLWKATYAESPEEGIELYNRVLIVNPNNSRANEGIAQLKERIRLQSQCPICGTKSSSEVLRECQHCKCVLHLDDVDAFRQNAAVRKDILKAAAQGYHSNAKQTNNSQSVYHLALCYLNLGYTKEAAQTLRSFLKMSSRANSEVARLNEVIRKLEQMSTLQEKGGGKNSGVPVVLVVDDSATMRKLVSVTLSGVGYQVQSVANADETLDYIRRNSAPQLFILDVNMPGIDGFQLCKNLRHTQETAKVPVVFLTGKDGFLAKLKGQWVGATGYLVKPFDPKQLVDTVQKLLPLEVRRG